MYHPRETLEAAIFPGGLSSGGVRGRYTIRKFWRKFVGHQVEVSIDEILMISVFGEGKNFPSDTRSLFDVCSFRPYQHALCAGLEDFAFE
jgi:hypothetical protein